MKKFYIIIGFALIFVLHTLVGCTGVNPQESGRDSVHMGSESETEGDYRDDTESEEEEDHNEEKPSVVSPFAILDTVDISAAFGDRDTEGCSFALKAEGDLSASYGFRLNSAISDTEKVNLECGVGLGLEDLFGMRSDNNPLGFGLFGGGKLGLFFNYRGPYEDSSDMRKSFDVGFRHDGDLIWYAREDENEEKMSLSELKGKIEEVAMTKTFRGMENAFFTIPEELKKGVSLRLAVEKLIDLGFTAEIDDSDGITILLKANAGFYTDLLNDMLEEFIPAKWLDYLPRADFGYQKTVFDILLSFDRDGIFKEYSMSSDVALTASLEVGNLFFSESVLKSSGNLSFTAYNGELPNIVAG